MENYDFAKVQKKDVLKNQIYSFKVFKKLKNLTHTKIWFWKTTLYAKCLQKKAVSKNNK